MAGHSLSHPMHSSDATAQAAAALGPVLTPGDTLLLSGPVGAGKTHLRAISFNRS
ncbi:unnamed protein product [Ectocarpus fasciculatus]